MRTIVAMLADPPQTEEFSEALAAYAKASDARDKAHDAWRIAEQRLKQRHEALEAAFNTAAGTERTGRTV